MIDDAGYFYIVNAILFGIGFVGTQAEGWGGVIARLMIGAVCLMNIMAAVVSFGYVVQI